MPQTPMTAGEHHRMLNLSMIVVAAAVIVALLYWWSVSVNTNKNQPAVSSALNDQRAQIAAALRGAPVHISQQEINNIATQLKGSPVIVTDAQKQAIANSLRQAPSQQEI